MVLACDCGCEKTLKQARCVEGLGALWGDAPGSIGLGRAGGQPVACLHEDFQTEATFQAFVSSNWAGTGW